MEPVEDQPGEDPGKAGRTSGLDAAWSIRLLYLLTFAFIGAEGNYFPLWLRAEGWQSPAIGWLEGIKYGCLMLFPLAWGRLADRSGDGVRVLRLIGLGSVLAFTPLLWTTAFWPVAVAIAVWGAFRVGQVPALDTVTLAHVGRTREHYVHYRVWGSGGFIAGGFFMGALVAGLGRGSIPLVLLALLAAALLLALSMPPEPRRAVDAGPPGGAVGRLLRDPGVRGIYLVTFVARFTCQGLFAFLPLHLKDLGVPDALVPMYWSVGVVSEILLIRVAPRLFGAWSTARVLGLCFLLGVVQYALTAVLTDPWALLPVMALHGFTFGVWYVTSIVRLGERVRPGDRATAQALFQTAGFGLGGMTSSVVAGYLFESGKGPLLFGTAAVASLAPLALSAFLLRPAGALPRDEPSAT